MQRILITGSRDWPDRRRVHDALSAARGKYGAITVVEGGAEGADWYSREWAYANAGAHVAHDPHPADWDRDCDERCYHKPRKKWNRETRQWENYCPVAGHYRNQKMVDLGAIVCLAFPLEDSRGTYDCMKRAKRAGIEVVNLGWGGERCCGSIEYHVMPHQGCILR